MPLTTFEAYADGCLGGLGAGLLIYVVPALVYAHRTDDYTRMRQPRWYVLTAVLLLILTAISGLGPLIFGGKLSTAAAIKLGIGAQGTLKGIAAGGREATSGPREPTSTSRR